MTNKRRSRADVEEGGTPTPLAVRAAPIRLATAEQIRCEMARVYRDAKRGRIPTEVAARLVWMLGEVRKTHELTVLEAQLSGIELAMEQHTAGIPWRPSAALPAPAVGATEVNG